jgi:hypothetical protein
LGFHNDKNEDGWLLGCSATTQTQPFLLLNNIRFEAGHFYSYFNKLTTVFLLWSMGLEILIRDVVCHCLAEGAGLAQAV